MVQELGMHAPEIETTAEMKSTNLRQQVKRYLGNFATAVEMAQKNGDLKTHSESEAESRVDQVMEIINRNDRINRDLNSERYQSIREREKQLKGNIIVGITACVDPRIPRYVFGREMSMWKVPAGEIDTARRPSDNKRIPRSPSLRSGIKNAANSDYEFLEIAMAHYDSIHRDHGCAAIGAMLNDLDSHESLNYKEKFRISQHQKPEDSNLELLEQTTMEAVTNYYNIYREKAGKDQVKTAGVVILYDTDTIGLALRKGDQELSTKELTSQHSSDIEKLQKHAKGKYKDNFTDEKVLLDFLEDITDITETLINGNHPLVHQVDNFIDDNYVDLSSAKKKALRWVFTRMCAVQYLTDTFQTEIPSHDFVQQVESPTSVSLMGETLGEFDTKQHFWTSPGDSPSAIKQSALQVNVVRRAKNHSQKPTTIFVCSSADSHDAKTLNKGYSRSIANNESLVDDLVGAPQTNSLLLSDQAILIPIIINDETRETIEVPDHTGAF